MTKRWPSSSLLSCTPHLCVRLTSFQAILCTAFPQATGYGGGYAILSHLMATFIMVKAKGSVLTLAEPPTPC